MKVDNLIDHFFRTEYGKAVSHLTNRFGSGNLELAEDAVQDTLIKAMQTWPYAQVPDNPTGWILRVAGNKMIDQLRRGQKQTNDSIPETSEELNDISLNDINDDMIKMMFACCHPTLSAEYQIILTLKILGGLSIREISTSLLKKEETVAKAYTRAKKKFKEDEIKLLLPPANEVEKRLEMVLKIIYLLFNEGYKSAEGKTLIREDLCAEAVRLNRVLLDSELCNTPSANALMALMHFHSSRFDARVDETGEIVSLEDQDRSKWNQELILIGQRYLHTASESDDINDYLIQAAISSYHCGAASFEETNWIDILKLYDLQLQINPSPIIRLNRIVPMEKVHGSMLAYAELEELEETGFFDAYYLFYAIKGSILQNLGEIEESAVSLKKAISLTKNEREIHYLNKKLAELSGK
ncbi:MAG: sigma-70 family RNA polymerase sigma factor [Cyclobacteriaceae bacterium]